MTLNRTGLKTGLFIALAVLLAAAAVIGGLHYTFASSPAEASSGGYLLDESSSVLSKTGEALAEIAELVKPSVVSIITERKVAGAPSGMMPFFNDPFFRRFFGDRFGNQDQFHGQERRQEGLGSGVIVDKSGYILTNNHVVDKADEIKVVLSDKRELKGELIGTDPKTDLAVIKIDADGLHPLELGDSDKLRVGEIVVAVGNPYQLNLTVTMGIVSAKGRANVGIADYEDFIQTDAAINPGNSGGAMVNSHGELVGINTAIFSTSGGYQGIGFAIPSNMARLVMDQLLKSGKVIRGWLGVVIQQITPELAKQFDLPSDKGVLVSDVVKNGPAGDAGMKRGDVIVGMDGKETDQPYTLRNMVAATPPGTKVRLKVLRDGREKTIKVKLGELDKGQVAAAGSSVTGYDNALKGVAVETLTDNLRERLNLPEGLTGVVVSSVDSDSPADSVLSEGDVILEINRQTVENISDYERLASGLEKDSSVLLLVFRKGNTIFLTISGE